MTEAATEAGPVGVIYTGGTFGMVRSSRGYVPSSDLPERSAAALADAGIRDLPRLRWLDHGAGPPVNSSDITPRFWYELADSIRRHADNHAGFVVIHGTDTLAFTGSALSFLLADLARPVIVTGARAPLGEAGSDALDNLIGALRVAASGRTDEVTIAFGGRLLRANRASKRHGSRAHVFASPNADALAHLGHTVEWLAAPAPRLPDLPRGSVHRREVAMLPVYPGINGDLVRAIIDRGVHGIILEAYPAGVGPGGDADFVAAIRAAIDRGVIVAAASQSQHGRIELGRYATSTPLAEAGLLGAADMTREAALTKLHWLLGADPDPDAVRKRFVHNLCGEMTEPETG